MSGDGAYSVRAANPNKGGVPRLRGCSGKFYRLPVEFRSGGGGAGLKTVPGPSQGWSAAMAADDSMLRLMRWSAANVAGLFSGYELSIWRFDEAPW